MFFAFLILVKLKTRQRFTTFHLCCFFPHNILIFSRMELKYMFNLCFDFIWFPLRPINASALDVVGVALTTIWLTISAYFSGLLGMCACSLNTCRRLSFDVWRLKVYFVLLLLMCCQLKYFDINLWWLWSLFISTLCVTSCDCPV